MAAIHPPADDVESPPAPLDDDALDAPEEAPDEEPSSDQETLKPPIVDPDGEIAALSDRSMPIERRIWAEKGGKRVEKVYVQKGLGWFGKIELYGILGQAVQVVLSSDNTFNLNQIMDAASNPRQIMAEAMGDTPPREDEDEGVEAARMMAIFAQIVAISPQLLRQAYCVMLDIDENWRPWAVKAAFPNMDDEMGQDIIHAFIAQNWKAMEHFFSREVPKVAQRVMQERKKASAGRR
jgi:hypothetical protein